jgi:hypothetical protein
MTVAVATDDSDLDRVPGASSLSFLVPERT